MANHYPSSVRRVVARCEAMTCILRMRLRHHEIHAFRRMRRTPQPSALEVSVHHGLDHWTDSPAPSGGGVQVSKGMVVELCLRLPPTTSSGVSRVSVWLDGWWLSCVCEGDQPLMVVPTRVSVWSIIKSKHSQLQSENEETIKCEEAMIDKQIIAQPNEHVRGVTHIFGKPG